MRSIRQTDVYAKWFADLDDRTTRARIDIRIRRLALGNAGDVKPVGEGVCELRLHFGPGYRLYFTERAGDLVILLVGGDKSSQRSDIRAARTLARDL